LTDDEVDVAAAYPALHVRFGEGCVECDVGALIQPDLGTVDALARLVLAAQRLDRGVRLRGASPFLRELLAFVGLEEVLPHGSVLLLEAGRQPEQREEPGCVQEERDPGDLAV
jgi:hypothetical protein